MKRDCGENREMRKEAACQDVVCCAGEKMWVDERESEMSERALRARSCAELKLLVSVLYMSMACLRITFMATFFVYEMKVTRNCILRS